MISLTLNPSAPTNPHLSAIYIYVYNGPGWAGLTDRVTGPPFASALQAFASRRAFRGADNPTVVLLCLAKHSVRLHVWYREGKEDEEGERE